MQEKYFYLMAFITSW